MDIASLKRQLYLGPARRIARRLGIRQIRASISTLQGLVYALKYRLHPASTARVQVGDIHVDLRVSSSTELHKHKTLGGERQLLTHLVEMVRPGDVVYDIGANIGLFTVIFAKAIGAKGRIIAFEPEEKAHRRLTENIQQNELATVEPFQFALGNQAGSLTLSADSEAASGVHSAVRATAVALDSTTQVVDVMTGDDFIAKYGAPLPNLIKLDVEGMEYDVLSGFSQALRSPICRLVVCEVHFSILESRGEPEAPAAIERLLRDSGFHVEWHDASHLIATKNGSRR